MKTDQIKKRNMTMQVVLMIITMGIYALYWFYSTLKELHIANGKDEGAVMWTLFLLVLSWLAVWHYSSEYTGFATEKYPALLVFLAWLVFLPIVWFLVQTDLNKAADGGAA